MSLLSPAQQRDIEKAVGIEVLDRTNLILEIFRQRAKTREGRLQVELARLTGSFVDTFGQKASRRTWNAREAVCPRPAVLVKSRSNLTVE